MKEGDNRILASLEAIRAAGGTGGGGGGDASAANQLSVQASPGSDATKAQAVQGVTGGKAVSINQTQMNGTAVDANTGNASAGTQRVVLATNQPAVPVTVSSTTAAAAAANLATGQVTAGAAGTLVIARATRRSVTIKNTDAAITVYIGPATVTSGNGMPLKAGESITVRWVGLVQVLAASGSPVVAYMDEYD